MSASDSTRKSMSDSWTPPPFNPEEAMTFIEEQRKTILEEEQKNTAQEELLNFLEHLGPSETVIQDDRGFEGDLDFSILEKCNFKGITSIELVPSKVTSITGLPNGLKKLAVPDNYLIEIPELPDSLVDLDVNKNALRTVGPLPAGLKELNVSKNHIDTLENLPASLEVLKCNDNTLHLLNLSGIENLRVLHCSGNPRLVIEGLPDTLVDFQMDNDVGTQIQKATDERSDNPEAKANYMECLYTYFELKKRYEDGVLRMKRVAYASSKNKKAARVKVADLKPKCIECARPVGSIFKKEGRNYIARCGDSKNPCSFEIELFSGEYSLITDMLGYYERLTEIIKEQIMIDKLKVLFHHVTEKEGVELFKTSLDLYTEEKVHMTTLKKEYDDLYFNEERNEKIDSKLKKIKEIQERIKVLFDKAAEEASESIVTDAMTIYVKELIPEMENLQIIKYDTREILVDEFTNVATLFQVPWRVQQIEYTFGEYPRVVKFRMK